MPPVFADGMVYGLPSITKFRCLLESCAQRETQLTENCGFEA